MAKHWIQWISCLTLISSLQAWAPKRDSLATPPTLPDSPLNSDQGWFTKEAYLLWLCYEDDMDWANKVKEKDTDIFSVSMKTKKPDFNWNSGVRVGIGRYLPNHNLWDVSTDFTYFYGNASSKSSPNREHDAFLIGKWVPTFYFVSSAVQINGASEGAAHWKLNFFCEDLSIGRQCSVTSMITARPFAGLRAVQTYEDETSRLSDFEDVPPTQGSSSTDVVRKMKFKGYSDFWGIGPRIGSDFCFKFSDNWSLLGAISGAFFFGHSKVKEKISLYLTQSSFPDSLVVRIALQGKDKGYAVRTNFEGSLGLGWEMWVKNHTVRLAPSLMFEASEWFDMNQWITFKIPTNYGLLAPQTTVASDARHGDIGFIGLTFNFHVDF